VSENAERGGDMETRPRHTAYERVEIRSIKECAAVRDATGCWIERERMVSCGWGAPVSMIYLMYTTSVANMTNHATTHRYASTRKALSVAMYPMAPKVMATSDNNDLHAEMGGSQVHFSSTSPT
jgi:hypothetical protein